MEIEFDKLISDYNSDLLTKLRSFNDELEYTKYWVPGSNKVSSLINLVDALYETSIFSFDVIINKEDTELINQILKLDKQIGTIQEHEQNSKIKFKFILKPEQYKLYKQKTISSVVEKREKKYQVVYNLKQKKNSLDISNDYLPALQNKKFLKFKNKNEYNKNLGDLYQTIVFEDKNLYLVIDKTNIIKDSFHDCDQPRPETILIDILCSQLIEKHIQEASEHMIIYLEHSLRPKDLEKKSKGIILPRSAGGLFDHLNDCLRKIYQQFKQNRNFKEDINKIYFGLSKEWIKLSLNEKNNKIQKLLIDQILPELKLSLDDIKFEKIEFETRVVMSFSEKFKKQNQGKNNYFIKVENLLKSKIDKRLELFTLERMDKNKLRLTNSPQKI